MSKKVLVSIVDGFHYRYLISSGVIDNFLVESGYSVDFVTSNSLVDLISERFPSSKIHIFEKHSLSFFNRIYMYYVFQSNGSISETVNIKSEGRKNKKLPKIILPLLKVFSFSFFTKSLFFIKRYDYLVLSTPAQKMPDIFLSFMARLLSKKIVSPVYSWDNLTAKGPFAFKPDKLLVWNDIMVEEAIKYQSMERSKVFSTGVPIYETYKEVLKSKEDSEKFCEKLGFSDPSKHLVTITTIPRIYYGDGHSLIVKAILNSELGQDVNVLVRPHPMDDTDYSALAEYAVDDNLVIDNYGSKPDSSLKSWMPKSDNVFHLGQTMMYSSVVINVASTITIDAAWFDTPVINCAIHYDENLGAPLRFYDYTHYKHVVVSGASELVVSEKDLLESISIIISGDDELSNNRNDLIDVMCLGRDYDSVSSTVKGLII